MRPLITYSPRFTESERQLLALPGRLRNIPAFARLSILPAALRMMQRHWESKGAAFGQRWANWAPSTLAARIRKGNVAQGILRDTDHLFVALFRALFRTDRVEATPAGARISLGLDESDDPIEALKFRWHWFGTSRMPARHPVPDPLPRSFRDEVRGLFRDFILTGRARGDGGRFVSFDGPAGAGASGGAV